MMEFYFNNHIWQIQSLNTFKNYAEPVVHSSVVNLVLLLDPSVIVARIICFSSFPQKVFGTSAITFNMAFTIEEASTLTIFIAAGDGFLQSVSTMDSINVISRAVCSIMILIA